MKILALNSNISETIADLLVNDQSSSRHMLTDRIERLEGIAGRKLDTPTDLKQFLVSLLNHSQVYFSTTKINSQSSNPIAVRRTESDLILDSIQELIDESNAYQNTIGVKLPLYFFGNKKEPVNINSLVYMYCIKSEGVIVLAMRLSGDIMPRIDDWTMNFSFRAITFLDFSNEIRDIPITIKNNAVLSQINTSITIMFLKYISQCDISAEHYEGLESDRLAVEQLSPNQKKLLNLYMSIFNRYGDIDSRVESIIDIIEQRWIENKLNDYVWIIYSYSYCFPYWFEVFYELLLDEEKEYLQNINTRIINDADTDFIVNTLSHFLANYVEGPI